MSRSVASCKVQPPEQLLESGELTAVQASEQLPEPVPSKAQPFAAVHSPSETAAQSASADLTASERVHVYSVQSSESAWQAVPAPGQGSARMSKSFLPEDVYLSPQAGSAGRLMSPHDDRWQMSILNFKLVSSA